jgi:hypothetical protein
MRVDKFKEATKHYAWTRSFFADTVALACPGMSVVDLCCGPGDLTHLIDIRNPVLHAYDCHGPFLEYARDNYAFPVHRKNILHMKKYPRSCVTTFFNSSGYFNRAQLSLILSKVNSEFFIGNFFFLEDQKLNFPSFVSRKRNLFLYNIGFDLYLQAQCLSAFEDMLDKNNFKVSLEIRYADFKFERLFVLRKA